MFEIDRLNILSILEAISKISDYSRNYNSADSFYNNQRDFDASMMNFIIIGEMVARLSNDFLENFNQIEWPKIKGLRNIVVHNYFGIDAEEVWDIIQKHLPKFKNDLQAILDKL